MGGSNMGASKKRFMRHGTVNAAPRCFEVGGGSVRFREQSEHLYFVGIESLVWASQALNHPAFGNRKRGLDEIEALTLLQDNPDP